MRAAASAVPGQLLLSGWPALAAGVIAANDLWLKPHHPGLVSGKLSDLAINFLLPLLLFAGWEWLAFAVARAGGRPVRLPPSAARWAVALSAGYFVLLQLVPAFTAVHAGLVGLLGAGFGLDLTAVNTPDAGDLATLVTAPLALRYLEVRARPMAPAEASGP